MRGGVDLHLSHRLERVHPGAGADRPPDTQSLPVAASLFITDIGVDWGRVMAMGSLIAIPPLIFTFIAARQIITGLTAGAVKG